LLSGLARFALPRLDLRETFPEGAGCSAAKLAFLPARPDSFLARVDVTPLPAILLRRLPMGAVVWPLAFDRGERAFEDRWVEARNSSAFVAMSLFIDKGKRTRNSWIL
jgi:hypothetical protein